MCLFLRLKTVFENFWILFYLKIIFLRFWIYGYNKKNPRQRVFVNMFFFLLRILECVCFYVQKLLLKFFEFCFV